MLFTDMQKLIKTARKILIIIYMDGKCIKWVENITRLSKDFIKTIMMKVMKNIFLKLIFNIPKHYINFTYIGIEKGS